MRACASNALPLGHSSAALLPRVQTVLILSGGVILFGEHMPLGRFLGICVTMFGIVWYSWINVQQAAAGKVRHGWRGRARVWGGQADQARG